MNRDPKAPVIIGRYALYDEIASGGMATVFLGALEGTLGFRPIAITVGDEITFTAHKPLNPRSED